MSLRFRLAKPDEARILLLARDPQVISATRKAAQDMACNPPLLMQDARQVLSHLFSGATPPQQIVCQASAAGAGWPALLATATDPFGHTAMVVVSEHDGAVPPGTLIPPGVTWTIPEPVALARALQQAALARQQIPTDDPAALARGLRQGEIAVRYQPAVRIADRRPVLLEGLVRWQRRGDTPLSPDAFIPMAERNGLIRELSIAVARQAFTEMAGRSARIGAKLTLNLPLSVLMERDVLAWLRQLLTSTRFPLSALVLEMTETMPVQDRTALRRVLERLRHAGLAVLIDDMSLEEDRAWQIELPFAGIKLDRHLVEAMPAQRRARAAVQRLVRLAHRAGMSVTAEGVSDARLWRAVAAAGVDNAQGYAIARPLPAAALGAWQAAWQAHPLRGWASAG